MKEVIVQIQGLYDALVKGNDENAELKTKLVAKTAKLKEKEAKSDARSADMNARETAVRKIEDVKALSDATKEAIKKLKTDSEQLNIERTAFETYQEQTKQENTSLQKSLESSIEAANKKEAKLADDIKKLKAKEKKLREDIVKELQGLAKK